MPIPRHKTVPHTKKVARTVTHQFEFHRDDLIRLLRLPADATLTVVHHDGSVEIDGTDAVLFAKATETK